MYKWISAITVQGQSFFSFTKRINQNYLQFGLLTGYAIFFLHISEYSSTQLIKYLKYYSNHDRSFRMPKTYNSHDYDECFFKLEATKQN